MRQRTVIPFGPQHPVFPEPLQLKLHLEEERVIEAIPVLGYVHRGLEKLAEQKDFVQNVFLIERLCGICSFMHALCYCQGIESLIGLQVPDRARFLRTIWAELARLHSHHLWLGLLADALGFESLFMQVFRNREIIMDVIEATTGGRMIFCSCLIGGVRRDIPNDLLKETIARLDQAEKLLDQIAPVILAECTVKERTANLGIVTKEQARKLGAVGPVARASGIAMDMRTLGYAAYGDLDFAPIVEEAGDCYARIVVRVKEMYQSFDLIKQAAKRMPKGEHALPIKRLLPDGETVVRVEQPRGELMYYIRANGSKKLERVRVRTPTYANIPPLLHMLTGAQLANVAAVAVLSIDPCISCVER